MDFSDVFSTLLITFVALTFYKAYFRYKRFQFFKKLGFPGPKPDFILGNLSQLLSGSGGPVETIGKWRQKYGKVFGYFMMDLPTLVVADLDLIKQITIKDFQIFPDRLPLNSNYDVGIWGKPLIFLTGARWKHVRKTLSPAFSASKLRHLTSIMKRAVEDFGNELTKVAYSEKEFDIYDRFQRLTLDVVGESALALKINCQKVEENKHYEVVKGFLTNERIIVNFTGILASYYPLLKKLLQFILRNSSILKNGWSLFFNLKSTICVRRGQSTGKTVDMLQLMLEAAVEDQKMTTTNAEKPLTDDEIIGNCFVFILAGYETTATTLGNLSYLLAKHPDVQDKVYKEIQENVKDVLNVAYEDVYDLPYLDQVINETLRLYPPLWTVGRYNNQEYVIDGRKIPAGIQIEIPICAIQRDPEFWPEPDKFDPERFSPENKVNIHPAAHIPFGIGPRNCIGMRFALLEIKLAMIRLLREYRLVQSENFVLEREVQIVFHIPKNGIFVKLESRTA